MNATKRNWAGNLEYQSSSIQVPRSVEEVQERVGRAARVKALGSRHSFSSLADTEGEHLCLDGLRQIHGIDVVRGAVSLDAGVRYGELARYLESHGFALHNMASLPHISVAGAVATATHGSGDRLPNLAAGVLDFDLVTASGEIIHVSREAFPDEFNGMVVHLGALGVVTRLTLAVEPSYDMRQDVYLRFPFEASGLDAVTRLGDSVSLFTSWTSRNIDQVWVKRRVPAADLGETLLGAKRAAAPTHPLPNMPAENCTQQMGVTGPWNERLPHFRMEFTPSSGQELQSEYLIAREHFPAAFEILCGMGGEIAPLLHISEIRTTAADEFWTSPSFRRETVGIHFTWKANWPRVSALLPKIEEALAPLDARPHWGKLSFYGADHLARVYPKLGKFRELAQRLDPAGKFRNSYLEAALGPGLT